MPGDALHSRMSCSELATWDAVETSTRIRNRDISATEVLEAAIARCHAAEYLGAITTTAFDRARAQLHKQSKDAATQNTRCFAGVPTLVKDLANVGGVAMGWGSRAGKDYVSRKYDPFVQRFENTGAVILGKTATSELGLLPTVECIGQVPCRNPWDLSRSTGGSSGGAAALVAAGVVPFAHGSDGGGSVRIPAAACGLVGLKPTRARLDMEGSNLLPINIATHGILTRTVRDTVAFYQALETPSQARQASLKNVTAGVIQGLRCAVFVTSPLGYPIDSEHAAAAIAAGELCQQLGAKVEQIPCPVDSQVSDDFMNYWGLVAWAQLRTARLTLHRRFDATLCEPWSQQIAATFARKPGAAIAATRRLRRFRRRYAELMQNYDVLICPTLAQPVAKLGELAPTQPFTQIFEGLRRFTPFTPFQNISGAPALSLPWSQSSTAMPIGVQFAAAENRDGLLLGLGLAIERARPWRLLAPTPSLSAHLHRS